jgi:thiol-disulfide isomerase/thioredoxin
MKIISVMALGVAVLSSGSTAMSQDAKDILTHTADVYASLRTYTAEGVGAMHFELNGVKYSGHVNFESARGDTPDEPYTTHFNSFDFEPTNVTYAVEIGVLNDFSRVAQNVKSTRLLRRETLEANGKVFSCYAIEVVRRPDENDPGDVGLSPETLWIDTQSYLVLRTTYQRTFRIAYDRAPLNVNWLVRFVSYKLNVDPPKWLVDQKANREKHVAALRAENIGKKAAEFKLHDLDGRELKLSDLRDRVVLLNFWATWCGPCRAELPALGKIESEWSAKGLVVVRITDEPADLVQAFEKRERRNFRTFVDGAAAFRDYGIYGRPTTIILDRAGKISSYDEAVLTEAAIVDRLTQAGLK